MKVQVSKVSRRYRCSCMLCCLLHRNLQCNVSCTGTWPPCRCCGLPLHPPPLPLLLLRQLPLPLPREDLVQPAQLQPPPHAPPLRIATSATSTPPHPLAPRPSHNAGTRLSRLRPLLFALQRPPHCRWRCGCGRETGRPRTHGMLPTPHDLSKSHNARRVLEYRLPTTQEADEMNEAARRKRAQQ